MASKALEEGNASVWGEGGKEGEYVGLGWEERKGRRRGRMREEGEGGEVPDLRDIVRLLNGIGEEGLICGVGLMLFRSLLQYAERSERYFMDYGINLNCVDRSKVI